MTLHPETLTPEYRIFMAALTGSPYEGQRMKHPMDVIQTAYEAGKKEMALHRNYLPLPRPDRVRDWNKLSMEERQKVVDNWK